MHSDIFSQYENKRMLLFSVLILNGHDPENVSSKIHLVENGVGYLKPSIVVSPRRIIHGHY